MFHSLHRPIPPRVWRAGHVVARRLRTTGSGPLLVVFIEFVHQLTSPSPGVVAVNREADSVLAAPQSSSVVREDHAACAGWTLLVSNQRGDVGGVVDCYRCGRQLVARGSVGTVASICFHRRISPQPRTGWTLLASESHGDVGGAADRYYCGRQLVASVETESKLWSQQRDRIASATSVRLHSWII